MKLTLIGSGNVATHLGAAFKNAGHGIVQVYSRDIQHAALLAYHVQAEAIDDLQQVNPETELFIIAVKDDAINELAVQLVAFNKPIVHTSGGTDISVLTAYTHNAGVFYPLQTFSKIKELDFRTVPLCVEGGSQDVITLLTELAQSVSDQVYQVNSAQRSILHLSAVFACNFPNYLYALAHDLLARHHLSFDMLRPLIMETAGKVQDNIPLDVQTGPAVRNDVNTMSRHLEMLQNEPVLQQIYELLSQGIIKMDKGSKHHK
jgi:predicted short-subunit dehydrogenase-like oxidoreductase (DUF2520 family)